MDLQRKQIIFVTHFKGYCTVFQHALKSLEITGPEVIKLFSCSSQMSMNFLNAHKYKNKKIRFYLGFDKPRMLFFPLINVKMPTIVGILTFMSRKNYMLS